MNSDIRITFQICMVISFLALSDAFFLRWGTSDPVPVQGVNSGKAWSAGVPSRYFYEQHKLYSPFVEPAGAPIPISVPLQAASVTPVALQHVQLVPCMCPVAPEEADKLMEASPGPYLAQPAQAQTQQLQAAKH